MMPRNGSTEQLSYARHEEGTKQLLHKCQISFIQVTLSAFVEKQLTTKNTTKNTKKNTQKTTQGNEHI